jgi:prolipoprotein diacylglyceryl transferase
VYGWFIPSPGQGVWYLGPVPIRAYALCIIAGIFFAIWLGDRRWQARGGKAGEVADIALWAVPFGVIGGRLYWVITEWGRYFGPGGDPWGAFRIWEGGLGIWGAISFGALGMWIGARSRGVKFLPMSDALVPGVLIAQAIGRWGNYFNQELFGTPLDKPWALEIDAVHRPPGYENFATFHPTFLYESLWNLCAALLLLVLDRRFSFRHGQLLALYVLAYASGRVWIENLRIDPITWSNVGGLRLVVWVSMIAIAVAALSFVRQRKQHGASSDVIYHEGANKSASDAGPLVEAAGEKR